MTRRTFVAQASATTVAVSSLAAPNEATPQFIDCNITLGHWPFRDLNTDTLIAKLQAQPIAEAWAGSFESLFQRDLAHVNGTLVKRCQASTVLRPVGAVHPKLPNWREDLQRCASDHGMKAIRVHPNYHGYTLDDPDFKHLLAEATRLEMIIQVVAQMEDERTQPHLMQMKPVDFKPLPEVLQQVPNACVMILNANRAMSMTALRGCKVWLDIAMLEGVGGIENLLSDWPAERVVFGSHAPFFYWEAARLKLQESDLSEAQLALVTHANASLLTR